MRLQGASRDGHARHGQDEASGWQGMRARSWGRAAPLEQPPVRRSGASCSRCPSVTEPRTRLSDAPVVPHEGPGPAPRLPRRLTSAGLSST